MPSIIVHGGAGQWANADEAAVLAGVEQAARAGWEVLRAGGTATDAVIAATVVLEDHPLFDAGYGSFVNAEGEVEMDALLCDGANFNFGAVAGVRRIANAIQLARIVLEKTPHCFFVGDGADALAAAHGLEIIPNINLVTPKEYALFHERWAAGHTAPRTGLGTGTVGAVALDAQQRIVSATSTGGTPDKPKGRVGDCPIYGSGGYADDHLGGTSATGQGENIMRTFLCKNAVDHMQTAAAQAAIRQAVETLAARIPNPEAGLIGVDAQGRLGAYHSTAAMPIAWVTAEGTLSSAMRYTGQFG
jgi:L-asparaginase / beta-aspartyl-peptidase